MTLILLKSSVSVHEILLSFLSPAPTSCLRFLVERNISKMSTCPQETLGKITNQTSSITHIGNDAWLGNSSHLSYVIIPLQSVSLSSLKLWHFKWSLLIIVWSCQLFQMAVIQNNDMRTHFHKNDKIISNDTKTLSRVKAWQSTTVICKLWPLGPSGLLPFSVNKIAVGDSHAHWRVCCQWLLSWYRTRWRWVAEKP